MKKYKTQMNTLHLKYKSETGNSVYHEAETIKADYENYPFLAEYIEWLEGQITVNTTLDGKNEKPIFYDPNQ